MDDEVFARLADSLDRLPNGFPRTQSGVEIRLLAKIFTPEQAAVASRLTGTPETVEVLAGRLSLTPREARHTLLGLAREGLIWAQKGPDGGGLFRLAPFIVGIYEASVHKMDHEMAHLFEDYMDEGGVAGLMRPHPALHRVVPAHGSVKSEWILPYDDVRAIFEGAKAFGVRDCICRVQQDALGGRKCSFPVKLCMNVSPVERQSRPGDMSRDEAIAMLDRTEELGLVHTVSNVVKGVFYVCNCCGCCCGILRGVTEYGVPESVARANYAASIDPAACSACGVCAGRCQVGAIADRGGSFVVDTERCIGCGLCATGCPTGAATLSRRPDAAMVHPPQDFDAWERERLRSRGHHH
jgi:Na+-translocating ferredoxin:NAD+ oxidoreductase subunit B